MTNTQEAQDTRKWLTADEVISATGMTEGAFYAYVRRRNLEKRKNDFGRMTYGIDSAFLEQYRATRARNAEDAPTYTLDELKSEMMHAIKAFQQERDITIESLRREVQEKDSQLTSLSNQIASHHDIIQQRKEEQQELERLRKIINLIPRWLVLFFRLLSGDKL